jgi:ABC-type sugar transport system ATPase subunit
MIKFEHITKNFPGVTALSDVSFEVQTGECHALLGENGAGKSTLGKILAGMYRPDGGRILIDGKSVNFHSPRDAARAGVAIVHQELVFCPNLSVAENLCLHDLPRQGLFLDRGRLCRQATALLAQIGLDIDVDRPLSSLSIAQEQLVQIAAAVGLGAKILVFDEPTSSLGRDEVDRLFALIRRLQQSGVTIIYVSHRLEEIFELCQTVTVLRDGRHIATRPIDALDHDELVRLMVGRSVDSAAPSPTAGAAGAVRLQVRRFSSRGRFADFSLDLRSGEVVGLAGLVGAGRTEVLEALFGLDRHARGELAIDGKSTRMRSTRQAQRLGMTLIPEDRKRQGLVLGMNVRENLTFPILDRFRRALGWVDRRAETALTDRFRSELSIRAASGEMPVSSLSGGNQQKIVFARGLAAGCRILLVDEPTRGVDVGAKREIHDLVRQLAGQGTAVLLVSSDLPELLALSHRVVVLRQGRIVAELAREAATPDAVLRAMAGIGLASGLSPDGGECV